MAARLERLGRAAAQHWALTLLVWAVAIAALVGASVHAGGRTQDVFSIPGAPSQRADTLLEQEFASQSGDSALVVFQARRGTLTEAGRAAAVAATQARLRALPHATEVDGPTTPVLGPIFVSRDHAIAYARVQYDRDADRLPSDAFTRLQAATDPAKRAGVRVEFGDAVTDEFAATETGNAELIGLIVAVAILLLAFGSVIAMGLPIGTAIGGLAVGLSLIYLLASITPVGSVAPTLATMIGLGVGIDYSLFVLTRYRQNLAAGLDVVDAVGVATATAGQAVLFAGGTVVIAICGIAVAGIPYLTLLGLITAGTVLIMMVAAVTLIPALLGLAGRRIDRWTIRRHRGRHSPHAELVSPGWERWARFIARHRWPALITGVTLLLVLASPLLSMRLGQIDDGTAPRDSTQRHAYDLISKGFGPGVNGPLFLAVELPGPGKTQGATATSDALGRVKGVFVVPAQYNAAKTVAVVVAVPPTAPQAAATEALVDRLRSQVLPPAVRGTGARVYIGGATATFIDLGRRTQGRLPLFIGVVLAVSFLLLMMVFRSVFVPLKAAVMNLLSIGTAFGVIVAVFQWGWLRGLFGLSETIPIVAFVPMMTFAILFGLSMDYEVFLLSRIREAYHQTHDNLSSVVTGLGATARVITAAALIMISVFLGFVGSPEPTVKMFGLGLAVAVLVDATVVRLVLVPATMELLGDANWWLPRWLDRILPTIHLEEVPTAEPPVRWRAGSPPAS